MKSRRIYIIAAVLLFAVQFLWAGIPDGYYNSANGTKGSALKSAMCGIIYEHTDITYGGLWQAYYTTDVRSDGKLRDWYSKSTNYTLGTDQAGSEGFSKEGDAYNREHTVPKSWFNGASPIVSDCFHVVPTDGYVNGKRGNYPFGEVGTVTYKSNGDYCKLGSCKASGYTGTVFEPGDDIKGDIARIYFYMVTCYENQCTSWSSKSGGIFTTDKYPGLAQWTLDMFMRWSDDDPVDDVEKARNEEVYKLQGNRNPYVDYPGLEDYVWGDKKDIAWSSDVTSVESVQSVQRVQGCSYNLSGQRVNEGYKGIVILNGKKIFCR